MDNISDIVNQVIVYSGFFCVGLNVRTFSDTIKWHEEKREWLDNHKGIDFSAYPKQNCSWANYVQRVKENSYNSVLFYLGYPGMVLAKSFYTKAEETKSNDDFE